MQDDPWIPYEYASSESGRLQTQRLYTVVFGENQGRRDVKKF